MMKRLLGVLLILIGTSTAVFSQASGEIKGVITEEDGKTPAAFATVLVELDGKQVTGQQSDIDGKFWLKQIPTGTYTVKFSMVGVPDLVINNVRVSTGGVTVLNKSFKKSSVDLTVVEIEGDKKISIDPTNTTEGAKYGRDVIMKSPALTTNSVVAITAGVYTRDGSVGNFQGSRQGATVFIDGVKVRGGSGTIPRQGAEEVNAILGGVPAKYGDATGGIIEITTRNISSKFFGAVEGRTSQFLDNYGHHYFSGVFGGPMIKNKKNPDSKPIAGFMVAVEGAYDLDSRPGAGGWFSATDDTRNRITNDPIRLPPAGQSGTRLNAEYLRSWDFHKTPNRLNADRMYINGNAKFDINPARNTYISVGGYVNASQNKIWSYTNSMFNWDRNGRTRQLTWNVYGRFTQYFEGKKDEQTGKYKGLRTAKISLQVDYLKTGSTTEDVQHQDRLFNYGYVGRFDIYRTPTYNYGYDPREQKSGFLFSGFRDTLVSFTPSSVNTQIAALTSQYYSLYPDAEGYYDELDAIINGGAVINGYAPRTVYDMFNSPGTPYNSYGQSDFSQFRAVFTGTATIGDHDIALGFEFEQRNDASYSVAPRGLWTLGRLLTNAHLGTLDTSNPQAVYNQMGIYQDTINYNALYEPDPNNPGFGLGQSFFDYNLRQKLGFAANSLDFINIDALDPDFLSLDMFSADELYNQGSNLVFHYGYDVYGNRVTERSSFEDFFTSKDQFGNNTRPIPAFEPIYMAGYIQDRFTFKDIVFNIGVRIDRFDANQKVLKDRYSLYDTKKVVDVNDLGPHAGNAEDDWVVYVNDVNNPTQILGYRDGDVWYNSNGEQINDPTLLRNSSGRVEPYLVDPSVDVTNPGNGLFNAFTDYTPQVNVMPRISFSFPISEKTQFTAYYDVLTQRPNQGLARLNPLDYLFWDNSAYNSTGRYFNNPALRPERTTDFALAFRQILSESILLKVRAFYRELRDMVAATIVTEAYPRTYGAWTNIDFGTVKGFSVEMLLSPPSGNIQVQASYTLQFADGTGSSEFSQLNLQNSGQPNLRSTIPLSYDSRHQFKLFGSFTFGDLKDKNPQSPKYIGPRGKFFEAIFRNLGLSMTLYGNSGVPYSRQVLPTPTQLLTGSTGGSLLGSLNGARLPFEFYNDLLVDKTITLYFGKKKENGGPRKSANLNIYLQIQNLFDVRNIIGVYAATGSPTDDGYLTSPLYQSQILSTVDPQSYIDYYNMKVANPNNFSMPRRIRLGAIFSF